MTSIYERATYCLVLMTDALHTFLYNPEELDKGIMSEHDINGTKN